MAKTVLVVPGTGEQGRAATKEFLQRGYNVRILVRNSSSNAAEKARSAGALVYDGDLSSIDSLAVAFDKVDAVFLALPVGQGHDEITYATNVLKVAREKNVQHLVFTSVARTGDHESFPGWDPNGTMGEYWQNKHKAEEMVRAAGFPFWTILRPAYFSTNFCRPMADWMWLGLADKHELLVSFNPDTKLDCIHPSDIAAVAEAAIRSPSAFSGKELTLASESLTAAQMAEKLSIISGETVTVQYVSDSEIKKQLGDIMVASHAWIRDVGYDINVDTVSQLISRSTPMLEALDKERLGW
ncbi:hypothetical protein FB567DRAFT_517839 [Paraphoma chrysanthemicola]|uniref:NmrA-like domain-containing protein n=1 Tax=Paraphoma chrysanthemicola TaxID=798071 RepID=A0A8K0RBN2_9PLEO|nr:hypothetical protein FB567DRAFT_517839 [Paraphoma chrysanthemicola]